MGSRKRSAPLETFEVLRPGAAVFRGANFKSLDGYGPGLES
jgi:hypothetical protein